MRIALLATIVSAGLAGCASQEETLGAIQQRAIAECEVSSRGEGFAACYKAYVEEHRMQPRRPTRGALDPFQADPRRR